MSNRVFQAQIASSGAGQAHGVALTSSTYLALKGGNGTMIITVREVLISGFATSSAPSLLELCRVSTLETTATAIADPTSDGYENPSAIAQGTLDTVFIAAATGPQASATTTDIKLNLGLNLFGGIIRWQAAPGQEWMMIGNTASGGESVLYPYTGSTSGPFNALMIYEIA